MTHSSQTVYWQYDDAAIINYPDGQRSARSSPSSGKSKRPIKLECRRFHSLCFALLVRRL